MSCRRRSATGPALISRRPRPPVCRTSILRTISRGPRRSWPRHRFFKGLNCDHLCRVPYFESDSICCHGRCRWTLSGCGTFLRGEKSFTAETAEIAEKLNCCLGGVFKPDMTDALPCLLDWTKPSACSPTLLCVLCDLCGESQVLQRGATVIALGCVGQWNWHTPQPTQPGSRTSTCPAASRCIADSPIGHRVMHSVQSSPVVRTQTE